MTMEAIPRGPRPDGIPADEVEGVPVVEVPVPPHASLAQIVIIVLGMIGFLHFCRTVVLPIVLAIVIAMTLKPVVRWLAARHIPPPFGAGILMAIFVTGLGISFVEMGRPAMAWMDAAPQNVTQLRGRVQKIFSGVPKISQAVEAIASLGASEEERTVDHGKRTQTVEVKQPGNGQAGLLMSWTSGFVTCTGETLILVYLILASGDIFLQKLVHITPRWRDKKNTVEISHQIQRNLSRYIFSVSLINISMGTVAWAGFLAMGIPNPAMWGMLVCVLNFIPFLGPITGILLIGFVGMLTFDTLGRGLMPAEWYLLLHVLEASCATPLLLGRRFTLNPVVIFASLLFWFFLWGVPGAILAVPILVSLKVICEHVPALHAVGELINQ